MTRADDRKRKVIDVSGLSVTERPIRVLKEARKLKSGRLEVVGDDPLMPNTAPKMIDMLKRHLGPWEIVRIWRDGRGFYHVLIENK